MATTLPRGRASHQLGPANPNPIQTTGLVSNNGPFETTDHFLQSLGNWNTAIPLQFHWLLTFSSPTFPGPHGHSNTADAIPPGTTDFQHAATQTTPSTLFREPVGWNATTFGAQASILNDKNMNTFGCILAQGVVIPGESMSVDMPTVPNPMGFLPGVVGAARAPMAQLTVQFRETNTSFTDSVIRPWIIAASHLGLVARKGGSNIKRDIHVMQLAKIASGHSLVVRKAFTFHNCTPISMDSSNLTHDSTALQLYTTQWHFTNYAVTFHGADMTGEKVDTYLKKEVFKGENLRTTKDYYGKIPRSRHVTAQAHLTGVTNDRVSWTDEPDIMMKHMSGHALKWGKIGLPKLSLTEKPGGIEGIDKLTGRGWRVSYTEADRFATATDHEYAEKTFNAPGGGHNLASRVQPRFGIATDHEYAEKTFNAPGGGHNLASRVQVGRFFTGFERNIGEIVRKITGRESFGGKLGLFSERTEMSRSRRSYASDHLRDDPNRFTDDGTGAGLLRFGRGGLLQKVKDIVDVFDIFF
jgi:hypothetical protein